MADVQKKDEVVDSAVNELISSIKSENAPIAKTEEKPQEETVVEPEKVETPTQDAEADKKPEQPKIKLRGSEYDLAKPEDVSILEQKLALAEERSDDLHRMRSTLTNAQKEAANTLNAAGIPLKFIKQITSMKNVNNLREMLVEELGEEGGKMLDTLREYDPKTIRHPAEIELEKIQLQKQQEDGERILAEEKSKLVKEYGLTVEEMKQIEADAYEMYVATCPVDEQTGEPDLNRGKYAVASLTLAFKQSPLFDRKKEEKLQAKYEEKEKAEKKKIEDAANLKNGQPPKKTAGVSGSSKTPKSTKEIEISDDLVKDITLHLNGV